MIPLVTPETDVRGLSVQDAVKKVGLDWEGQKEELRFADGTLSGAYGVRRSDTKQVISYGTSVGKDWTVLPNIKKMAFFQKYIDAGLVTLEGAGIFKGGRMIFLIGKINKMESDVTPGDSIHQYIMAFDQFDGKRSVRVGFPAFRPLCWNAVVRCFSHKNSKLIRLRHSIDVGENFDNVTDVINVVKGDFEATMEQYKLLTRKDINQKDLDAYIKKVFEIEPDKDGKIATRSQNIVGDMIDRYYKELGTSFSEVKEKVQAAMDNPVEGTSVKIAKGTMWTAYNSITSYLTHERGRNFDNRMSSLFFGDSLNKNEKALEIALSMA